MARIVPNYSGFRKRNQSVKDTFSGMPFSLKVIPAANFCERMLYAVA
jgi:hypothetical protein